jgi:hypothetical protein
LDVLTEDIDLINVQMMEIWLWVMPLMSLGKNELTALSKQMGNRANSKEEREKKIHLQKQVQETLSKIRKKEVHLPYQPQIYTCLADIYKPVLQMYQESKTGYESLLTILTQIIHLLGHTQDLEQCQRVASQLSVSFTEGLQFQLSIPPTKGHAPSTDAGIDGFIRRTFIQEKK